MDLKFDPDCYFRNVMNVSKVHWLELRLNPSLFKMYDARPTPLELQFVHGDRVVTAQLDWVQGDSDPALNSVIAIEADRIIAQHCPG